MAAVKINLFTVKAMAKELGATVDARRAGKFWVVDVDAPAGKVWSATGDTHSLHAEWRDDPGWKEDALADLLERMEDGLADCEDDE